MRARQVARLDSDDVSLPGRVEKQHADAGAARNRGLEAARGRYLLFLDADDDVHDDLVPAFAAAARDGSPDACACSADLLDCTTGKRRPFIDMSGLPRDDRAGTQMPGLLSTCQGYPWNKLVSRDLVDRHALRFQEQPKVNDPFFTLSALAFAESVRVVPETLVTHCARRGTSLQDQLALHPECHPNACRAYLAAARPALEGTALAADASSMLMSGSAFSLCKIVVHWRDEKAARALYERGYDHALDGLAAEGRVILCGIAYDPKAKTHSCLIGRA